MATSQRTTVVGVFENPRDAQRAVDELRRAGFREDQIGVASHNREQHSADAGAEGTESHVGTGALTGAVAGAGVGAAWGLAIIAGLLPAIGPVIAGGTLAAILASAGLGAAAAGLAGALIGLGIPEEEAHYYEGEFKSGRTIVTVKADSRYTEAESIVRRFNGYDRSNAPKTSGQPFSDRIDTTMARNPARADVSQSGKTVQLHEEHLKVDKQPVQTGEVRVRKEVHTEHQVVDVPVRKEEVVIERRPVAGQRASSSAIKPGEEIRIPVSEERVSIEKETVVTEEVNVGKRTVQGTKQVAGDVRKEEVKIEKTGDAEVRNKNKKN